MKTRFGSLATIALVAIALLSGVALQKWLDKPSDTTGPSIDYGTVVASQRALPPFSLLGANDLTFSNENLQGKWTLMFFGFASCPDVCPTTLATLAKTSSLLSAEARSSFQVVFISVDPEKDTPAAAQAYAAFFEPHFLAATGHDAALRQLTAPLGILYTKVPLENGDYTMDHSTALLLLDPAGRQYAVFSAPHEAAALAGDLEKILAH